MIQHSEQLNELAGALAKAQAAVKAAKKDAANPFFKSTYADLASVWDACREALTSNGLSIVQAPGFEGGGRKWADSVRVEDVEPLLKAAETEIQRLVNG